MAHVKMTPAQLRQLGVPVPSARTAPRPRQRPPGYPPDVDNGHTWQRDGRGLQCQQCGMWIPLHRMSLFAHGAWRAALDMPSRKA